MARFGKQLGGRGGGSTSGHFIMSKERKAKNSKIRERDSR